MLPKKNEASSFDSICKISLAPFGPAILVFVPLSKPTCLLGEHCYFNKLSPRTNENWPRLLRQCLPTGGRAV